jgi:hypothetical protein
VILSFDTIKGKEEMSSMNAFKEKLREGKRGQERGREGKMGITLFLLRIASR